MTAEWAMRKILQVFAAEKEIKGLQAEGFKKY